MTAVAALSRAMFERVLIPSREECKPKKHLARHLEANCTQCNGNLGVRSKIFDKSKTIVLHLVA